MLVLKTTSPPATPSAPAASPRNHVPSSSASTASLLIAASSPPPASILSYRRGLPLERRGHAILFGRRHLYRPRPRTVAVEHEAQRVRADLHERKRQRRDPDLAPVEKHRRARRPRLDDERHLGCGRRRRRGRRRF